jgi:hypothetical protein
MFIYVYLFIFCFYLLIYSQQKIRQGKTNPSLTKVNEKIKYCSLHGYDYSLCDKVKDLMKITKGKNKE